MNTAQKLKKLREEKKLSQAEVAKLLNINRTTYVKWETGASLPIRKINEVAQLFNVTTDYLLGNNTAISSNKQVSPKDQRDLAKFLDQTEIMFDGEVYKLDNDDKEKVRSALEFAFWHAKNKNKRKNN